MGDVNDTIESESVLVEEQEEEENQPDEDVVDSNAEIATIKSGLTYHQWRSATKDQFVTSLYDSQEAAQEARSKAYKEYKSTGTVSLESNAINEEVNNSIESE